MSNIREKQVCLLLPATRLAESDSVVVQLRILCRNAARKEGERSIMFTVVCDGEKSLGEVATDALLVSKMLEHEEDAIFFVAAHIILHGHTPKCKTL